MTRIDRFTSRTDAELARAVLEANGIEAYVSGDDAGGLHPELPYGIGGTAVVVPEDRYADALTLLDEEFGSAPGDAAGLEAAALAAGPHPDGDAAGSSTDSGTAAGRTRPWRLFVVVAVLVMLLAAILTTDAFSVLQPTG